MTYIYFIFFWMGAGSYGNVEIKLQKPITTIEQVREVETVLKAQFCPSLPSGPCTLAISNYQLLSQLKN